MNDKLPLLDRCPFCGGKAIIDGCDDTLWIVICKKCSASIGHKETEQEAIDAWNSRVEPTFTPDELDTIKRIFVEHFSRKPNEGAIIEKCAAALKGGAE